ncbi:hypothetical protein BH10ACI4_BH10ACI4_32530 [soil metagenome]
MTTRRLPIPVVVPEPKRFYGKYRGTVLGNLDPMQIGRVMVEVLDVLGASQSTWAMPCVPAAELKSGIISLPPVGAHVWVEFEQGDPSLPIWSGGFWLNAAEVRPLV